MKGAVAAMLVLVVAVLGCTGDDAAPARVPSKRERAQAWSKQAASAYGPLGEAALPLPGHVREWLAGTRTLEQLGADLAAAETASAAVRDAVAKLSAFPFERHVQPLYLTSAELYVQHVRVYKAALGVPAGDARTQLDLMARRIRTLGDRVFDRGQALLQPYLGERVPDDVVVHLPEEVPDWVAEGVAAGPPLAPPPGPPAATPPLRQADRPEQPRHEWEAVIRNLGASTDADVAAAIAGADAGRLGGVADTLGALVERLRSVPDPEAGREESARLRLDLLLRAEAARAAQAGVVFADAGLVAVGRDLSELDVTSGG